MSADAYVPLPSCVTKAEHDALMATRRRPLTQDPIKVRTEHHDEAPSTATISDLERLAERRAVTS